MKKNTYSLLSSNWMFSGDSQNQLMPFLFNIINGTNTEVSLNATQLLMANSNGDLSPFNASAGTINTTDKKVAVIQVHHPIFKYDQGCGPRGTQSMISILESWSKDESIIGVVMDYNSGGGQASGTPEIAKYIFNYNKPVVSYTNDLVGSAALYMYAAAKYRMVSEYADFIGCIGTMIQKVDLTGVIEKAGGKVIELYSDLSPEKNFQSRELANGNERPIIEKILNPNAKKFHDDMKMFLPNITENALKGDVFSPEEAIVEGLADGLGTLQDAINKVFELSKTNKSNNSKQSNMNTKQLPNVQSVLGLDAPLASTEENGTYLNAEQLEALENRIAELEAANVIVTEELATANANTELNEQLTASAGVVASMEVSIDAMLTAAGLEIAGTIAEKTTALSVKVSEMGLKDAGVHTSVKIDADNTAVDTKMVGGVDVSGALNN